jgi:hypothetical protein
VKNTYEKLSALEDEEVQVRAGMGYAILTLRGTLQSSTAVAPDGHCSMWSVAQGENEFYFDERLVCSIYEDGEGGTILEIDMRRPEEISASFFG